MDSFWLLISTIAFRPYVFVFLAFYFVTAVFKVGPRKAGLFTLSAWFIAYLSEFSSVRNGIPFGLYHYIPSTVGREIWLWGIPFIDSLSFTFLAYTSWTMARFFISPSRGAGLFFSIKEPPDRGAEANRFSWEVILLGAVFFMLIDVIIDPLALRGDQWFLGKIYYYPEPGAYFGVTIANFAGWFVVGLAILTVWRVIDQKVKSIFMLADFPTLDLWGPALYFGVAFFNLYMTFWIGEYALGWAGVFIFLPVCIFFLLKLFRRL